MRGMKPYFCINRQFLQKISQRKVQCWKEFQACYFFFPRLVLSTSHRPYAFFLKIGKNPTKTWDPCEPLFIEASSEMGKGWLSRSHPSGREMETKAWGIWKVTLSVHLVNVMTKEGSHLGWSNLYYRCML